MKKLFAKHFIVKQPAQPETVQDPLSKRVTLDCQRVPLINVLTKLKESLDVSIVLDDYGLEQNGVTTSTPVSIEVKDVAGSIVLDQVVSQLGLGFQIDHQNRVVMITSIHRKQGQVYPVTYLISDRILGQNSASDLESLAQLISSAIAPESWISSVSTVSIESNSLTQSLTIFQTEENHMQIAELLRQLHQTIDRADNPSESKPNEGQRNLPQVLRMYQTAPFWPLSNHYPQLSEVRVEGNSTVLESEILKHIRTRAGFATRKRINDDVDALVRTRWFTSVEPIIERTKKGTVLTFRVVERPIVRRVEFIGVTKVKPQIFDSLTGLKPGSPFDVATNRECCDRIRKYYAVLGFLRASVKLEKGEDPNDRDVIFLIEEGAKYRIREVKWNANQMNVALTDIQPATAELAVDYNKQDEQKRSTPIAICYPVADMVVPRASQLGSEANSTIRGTLDLIDRIKDEVQPENWLERGGKCTLVMNEATLSFVIRAPMETHDQIQALLERIRRDRGELIEFETVIFRIDAATSTQLGGNKILDQFTSGQEKTLTEEQFGDLKRSVEQAGGRTSYIPKITTVYGAFPEAHFSANEGPSSKSELHLYMRGVLTADRKDLRLSVATNPNRLLYDFTTRQHRVADGQALLLDMSPSANLDLPDSSKGKVLVAILPRRVKEEEKELATPATDRVNPQK